MNNKKPLVGVYGVTSVGKSTFLNAMLQSKELKVGMGETTVKNHVIQHKDDKETPVLFDSSIKVEHLFKDIPILKKISLIDVPGTNKSFSDGSILKVMDNVDVVVWVFDAHGDISKEDDVFLKEVILKKMIKTIVVLNKIDSGIDEIDSDEREDFILQAKSRRDSIVEFFDNSKAKNLLSGIFPISAKYVGSTNNKVDNKERKLKIVKEWQAMLVSISKDSISQKDIFSKYNEISLSAKEYIENKERDILKQYENKLKVSLSKISDDVILSKNINSFDSSSIKINILNYFESCVEIENNILEEKTGVL